MTSMGTCGNRVKGDGVKADKYYSFPISSITKSAVDDDLIITGVATDATLDSDFQVCAPSWSGPAMRKWIDTGGNVRQSHDAKRPIGKGLSCTQDSNGAVRVKSLIVDPLAQKFIRKGVLRDYSVGIANPVVKPDPTGYARGGVIVGGDICELTVCDRGANPSCGITIAKSVNGKAQFIGKAFGKKSAKEVNPFGDFFGKVTPADNPVFSRDPGKAASRKQYKKWLASAANPDPVSREHARGSR